VSATTVKNKNIVPVLKEAELPYKLADFDIPRYLKGGHTKKVSASTVNKENLYPILKAPDYVRIDG